jgi:CheY-like chemotaxis protein
MNFSFNVMPQFEVNRRATVHSRFTADLSLPRVLVVTCQPASLNGLSLDADWASSVPEALRCIAESAYGAVFIDVVLPENQSGYRLTRRLRSDCAVKAPIYLMCEHPLASGRAAAQLNGATGMVSRRCDALLAALEGDRHEDVLAPACDPRFVDAIIEVAQLFLASEAERVVRRKMKMLWLHLGRQPSPQELIVETCEVLDDQNDRIKFTRLASKAAQ